MDWIIHVLIIGLWCISGVIGWITCVGWGDKYSKRNYLFDIQSRKQNAFFTKIFYVTSLLSAFILWVITKNNWLILIFIGQTIWYIAFFLYSKKHPSKPLNIEHLKIKKK